MSVIIHGLDMPKDGVYWCEIGIAGKIATITIHGEDRKSFPLVPLPEGHGKLVDADAIMTNLGDVLYKGSVRRVLMSAPTIVPAEGGGEE